MPSTLSAHEQTISRIFSDEYVFAIPGYQRPYSWGAEQASDLIEDLLSSIESAGGSVPEMPPYFLGSIVLIKTDGMPKADVVDGQQRLTTMTILLSAIRASVDVGNAGLVTPLIYEHGNAILCTSDQFRLSIRDRDQSFFARYIQREGSIHALANLTEVLPESQKNIRGNALLFLERLASISPDECLRIAHFLATRCYLVVVSTPDLDSAYRIFSVLNSRGLDLSTTDLLKAELIGGIPEDSRDLYTQRWEEVEEDLGRDLFSELFSDIRMIHRRSKPKASLLKEFREHVPGLNNPGTFIDQTLKPYARALGEIADASFTCTHGAEAVNESLKWLNRLEYKDWVPPALEFYVRNRQLPDRLGEFMADLERLSYFMLVTRKNINERIERFSRVTSFVLGGSDPAANTPLQLDPLEKMDFYDALNGPIYSVLAARARTSVMLRLDSLLAGVGAEYAYPVISVEHVLPQAPNSQSQWLEWFPGVDLRAMWTNRIGNLALLTRRKNASASNFDFERKKRAYFAVNGVSPFAITTQVLSNGRWDVSVVEARQRELMRVLEGHWRLAGRLVPNDIAYVGEAF